MLKLKIKEQLKQAMKAREQVKMDTLRSLISAFQYEEIQKGVEDLPDDAALAILKTELKKRKEELEFAEKANRAEQKEQLFIEIRCIEAFLPSQLDAQQLEKILNGLRDSQPGLNVGTAMKMLKDAYPGQYDGKLASDVAKKVLV